MRNSGRVLDPWAVIDRVWGADSSATTKTLDVHVKRVAQQDRRPIRPTRCTGHRARLGYKLEG